MERSIFWIMMDSRLRGNDRERGNDIRDTGMTEKIRNKIDILLKEGR